MNVDVRPAEPRDLEDLVRLRLENGQVHAALDPSVYRVPDPAAVREHFKAHLQEDDADQALLVAVVDGRVYGLAEVSLDPSPPAHQILLPDGVGIYAFQPNAAGNGYTPSPLSKGVSQRVTSLDNVLGYIAAQIKQIIAANGNSVPPPVVPPAHPASPTP